MNYREIRFTFLSFLALMTTLGVLGRMYGMDVFIYGKPFPQHISELMTEHEAVKSLNILSIFIISICFISAVLSWLKINSVKVDTYFKHPVSNFTLTLAAVSLATTFSVFISTLGMPGASKLVVFVTINLTLTLSMFGAIYFLNKRVVTIKNLSVGLLSTLVFISVLYRAIITSV